MSVSTTTIDIEQIQQWVSEKLDLQAVKVKLYEMGLDADNINLYLKEFRKLRIAQRQFTGFIFLATGAFLGFISCVLTLINPVPSLYEVILYGLTSVAILIIMAGLYYVFE